MKEFKGKNQDELRAFLTEKREALRQFKFANALGKTKNVKEGRSLRKSIAQLLTLINAAR